MSVTPSFAKIMLKYEQKRSLYMKERCQEEYYFFSQKGKQLTIHTVENVLIECEGIVNIRKDIRYSPHTCRHY